MAELIPGFRAIYTLLLFVVTSSMVTAQVPSLKLQKNQGVGDIIFNPKTDRSDFKLCHSDNVQQYYAVDGGYETRIPLKNFSKIVLKNNKRTINCYLTVRFIVNCAGEADRYRISAVSYDFKPMNIRIGYIKQLITIVKRLRRWKQVKYQGQSCDYYQYLTFKIKSGYIIDILP